MKLERQMAWPCHDCSVRGSSFCSTLIDETSQSVLGPISQVFLSAAKHEVIDHDGSKFASGPFVLCDGWAYRVYRFPDGRRQIVSVLIPGDLFSAFDLLESDVDFSVQAATDIQVCQLRRDDFKKEIATAPSLRDAFGKICSAEIDDNRLTLISLKMSSPVNRVAGFVQRIVKRLLARSIADEKGGYRFPLSNADIADATGLGAEDVGTAIASLRERRIVEIADGMLRVLDPAKLEETAMAHPRQ